MRAIRHRKRALSPLAGKLVCNNLALLSTLFFAAVAASLPPSSCLTNSIPQRRKLNNMCTGQHTHRLGHYCTYIRVAEVKGYQEEEGKQKK